MATTPTTTPETTNPPAASSSTVRLPDSAVIRPVPPVRVPPPAPTTRGPWYTIAGLVALLLIAFGVMIWQQGRVDDASTEATNSLTELQATVIESEALQAEVDRLERQLARADTRTESLERRTERLEAVLNAAATQGATLDQTEAELAQTQQQVAQTQQQLAETQAALVTSQANEAAARAAYEEARDDLYGIAGTPLADGPWTGRLYMVGGTQIPPMLAFDEMKLFRGEAAIDAMIADGVPVERAEACGPDCVYWRNAETGWRIMTIAADATVRIKTLQDGRPGPTTMGLQKFTRLFNGTAPQNAHFASAPYRLTMSGGEVTGIEELTVSW